MRVKTLKGALILSAFFTLVLSAFFTLWPQKVEASFPLLWGSQDIGLKLNYFTYVEAGQYLQASFDFVGGYVNTEVNKYGIARVDSPAYSAWRLDCPNDKSLWTYFTLCGTDYEDMGSGWTACKLERGQTGKVFRAGKVVYDYTGSNVQIGNTDETGITKSDIDTQLGSDFLESCNVKDFVFFWPGQGQLQTNNSGYLPDSFPIEEEYIEGECGEDDNTITNEEPPIYPHVLCLSGTASEVEFEFGLYWSWSCVGSGGGATDYCRSYNTALTNGACGSDDGQELSAPPVNLCSSGYPVRQGYEKYNETVMGYTWICGGSNGGTSDTCSATKADLELPDLPALDDCSQQSYPDKWLCEMSNTLKGVFLPSPEKLDELQQTINKITDRFPFSYLSLSTEIFDSMNEGIEEKDIELTLMGNNGTINLDSLEPLKGALKGFTSGLIILGFVMWGRGYIKDFFK